eukprot:CAMPEP_0119412258 /NCGR_PEP_ID=MMETSP1335-20130426/4758_1 /TAXON_ID=259385 /ORGANISM="Chrysoculter rhomboideus, Strain RCC1486" /LENGTH=111 /DNA_ID=CAMNT_0007436979 /DNA_START=189 /DNA_END=524 /DNA_ORIENTATION=-
MSATAPAVAALVGGIPFQDDRVVWHAKALCDAPRHAMRKLHEHARDVLGGLCGRLEEGHVILAGVHLSFVQRHHALLLEVRLVARECDDNVRLTLAAELRKPAVRTLKRLS